MLAWLRDASRAAGRHRALGLTGSSRRGAGKDQAFTLLRVEVSLVDDCGAFFAAVGMVALIWLIPARPAMAARSSPERYETRSRN